MKKILKAIIYIALCSFTLFSVFGCDENESPKPSVSTSSCVTSYESDDFSSNSTTNTAQDESQVTSNTETTSKEIDETSAPPTTEPPATEPPTTEPPTTEPPKQDNETTKVDYGIIATKYIGRWYLDGYADVYIDITKKTQYYEAMCIEATNYTFPFEGTSDFLIVPGYTIYPQKHINSYEGGVWTPGCEIPFDNWENELAKYKIKLSEKNISINGHIFVKTKGSISEGTPTSNTINFKDVEGVWYAEGHDDVTLTFSIMYDWVSVLGHNFNHHDCTLELYGGTGGTEFYYDNGYFTTDSVILVNNETLVYRKGENSVTFYRQKNYPQEIQWPHEKLLQAIDGYYWYLDGYEYTYLYPNVIPWYDHKSLDWESENIYIKDDVLVAYEDFEYSEYRRYESELFADSTTHNTLLVNPVEYAGMLMSQYDMHVSSNKLYMTVGDTTYSFTRHTAKKNVQVTLTANCSSLTVEAGEFFEIDITVSPFWKYHSIAVSSSNPSVVRENSGNTSSSDGNVTLSCLAIGIGDATLTFSDTKSNATTTVHVTVKRTPKPVTGITLDRTTLELIRGESQTIVATISPTNASDKTVVWSSSNNDVAEVSSSGVITAKGAGSATITATSVDGGYTATCTITVTDPPLTVHASMGVGYYFTSAGSMRAVYVEADASGGSGSYVEYYIKVYFNGELVTEGAKDEIRVTVANGTYTAEVYVKDSNGNEATNTSEMTVSGY